LHLLFKHAPGLGCSSGKIAEGVDVRADGGYAIWWPSTGRVVEDNPICEWPNWLLDEAMGVKSAPPRYPSKSIISPTLHDPILVADITAALHRMSAVDWRGKHDQWFELLMGCKWAGISLSDFTAWCVSDPQYADHADIIATKWHSVEPRHDGALWRELSKRKIKLGKRDNEYAEVPRRYALTASRNPDARLNYIGKKIAENPTEHALFSWSCLAAEIVHECRRKPSQVMRFIEGATIGTPLRKILGKEGIRRTVENAFRHVEEKLLKELETATQGD